MNKYSEQLNNMTITLASGYPKRSLLIAGACLFSAFSLAGVVNAQTPGIRPELVVSSQTVEQALKKNPGHASTILEGQGGKLALRYSSESTITVFLAPLSVNDSYAITDFIWFSLPKTKLVNVIVDLTISPGWTQGKRRFLLNFLSEKEEPDFAIENFEFIPAKSGDTVRAILRHFFTPELYTPSSFHALRGIRVLGKSFTPVFGVLLLLACGTTAVFLSKEKRLKRAAFLLVAGIFLYDLRFALDLFRFSTEHRGEYLRGTYDEAGSIYQVAAEVRKMTYGRRDQLLYVCRDGTNFKEKLLRYFTYPVKVSSEPRDLSGATLAVVMDKYEWNFDESDNSENDLACGELKRQAEKSAAFPDGSVLFRLYPLPKK